MSTQENEISISFPKEKDEVITSVFLLEDLIKEYNYKVIKGPAFNKMAKYPLSLRPISVKSNNPTISPMTKAEVESMRFDQFQGSDLMLIKQILKDQFDPTKGLASNIPTIAAGATMAELLNELGLKGQVYYKNVGDKVYVILKGLAGERYNLKGTRYLNTHPEIVRLGLAKVDVKTAFKTGVKSSLWVYGAVKAIQAIDMIMNDGQLKTSFFSEIVTDIPKVAITTVVAAAATGAVAAIGVPVAVGVGIVLVVGFAAGIALEFIDKKIGLTEKLNEAADTMWKNLKEKMNFFSINQEKLNHAWDPLQGLVFGGPFARSMKIIQNGNHLVYTA